MSADDSAEAFEAAKYQQIVEWSAEDGCWIGRCPELCLGGVHGADEASVRAELAELVKEWIAENKLL